MPQAVKFGDIICLWSAISDHAIPGTNNSPSSQTNPTHPASASSMLELGMIGLFDMDAVRPNNLKLHKCDSLVCVALPSERHFTPSYFRVLPECYYAHLKLGSPVSYGDVVVLMDVDGKVWNNKIGFEFNGHFAPTDKLNRPGEMTIAFVRPTAAPHMTTDSEASSSSSATLGSPNVLDSHHESMAGLYYGEPKSDAASGVASSGRVLCYDDDNVLIQVVDSNRLRLGFNQILTRFRKKSTPVVHGSYLRCDGRGTTLRVTIKLPPAPVVHSMWILPATSTIHDTRTSVDVPDHNDVTGMAVTITTALQNQLHMELGDSFGSVDIPVATCVSRDATDLGLMVGFRLYAKAGDETWTVDVVQPTAPTKTTRHRWPARRPIQLILHATATNSPLVPTGGCKTRAVLFSTLATHGFVLGLAVLYVVAVATGDITASTPYGKMILWAKPLLPLAWVASSWWMRRQHQTHAGTRVVVEADQIVTIQLTIVSWSVVADLGSSISTDGNEDVGMAIENPRVDDDAASVPRSFVVAEFGNVAKAQARYNDTLVWRKENRVDDVLTTPQVHYHTIRQFYKQCVHKHDKEGHPVYIEKLGGIDLKGMLANGITLADLFGHYLFNIEYIFNH
ncbi:hypothetical protein DYB32_003243, partial [Aphanomyces invadans]